MMHRQESGPARVGAQVGAEAVIDTPIIVEVTCSDQPSGRAARAAIDTRPCGHLFGALLSGTYHQCGGEWRRIADFVAVLHGSSLGDLSAPARLVVHRAGRWLGVEISPAEFRSSSWVASFLGSDAAASVTDHLALRWAIVLFGFVTSGCRGCRHEA